MRTDNTKKHEGISFLLFDMASPGVEPRPIKLISGQSPFCETFFTDVKVPKSQLVGKLNGGWDIAKRLLQYERQNISSGGFGGSGGYDLEHAALDYIGREDGKLADADLRGRITRPQDGSARLRADGAPRRRGIQTGQGGLRPRPRSSNTPPPR